MVGLGREPQAGILTLAPVPGGGTMVSAKTPFPLRMKFPYAISVVATISLVAFGVVSLLLDLSVREKRIDVGVQERQIYTLEAQIAELTQARQASDERREAQERVNDDLRKKIIQQQTAIQTQQEQLNRGTQIAQQVAPNLLHDLAAASLKNEKLKGLLTKHGYTVQTK